MTHAFAASAPAPARRWAIAAAIAATVGLGAPAAWLAFGAARTPDAKHAVRLAAGPVVKRELAFYPQERAADDSIRNFRPGKAWSVEPAPAEPAPGPVAQAPAGAPLVVAAATAKPKFTAPPLPPVRPMTLAKSAPAELAPRYADLPQPKRTEAGNGFHLAKFVPTGGDVMKKIGGLGETMRDSIGSVGSSLGKLMRISSR